MLMRTLQKLRIFQFTSDLAKKQSEWNTIYQSKQASQIQYLDKHLTQESKTKVQLLADAMLELDPYEIQCLLSQMHEQTEMTLGVGLCDLDPQWPIIKQLQTPTWPPESIDGIESYLKQAFGEDMPDFKAIFGGGSGSFSGNGAPAKSQSEAPKEEVKEKVVAEKLSFDLELSAIDAAQKIKIIKEVRQLLNLGLKEAKDTVEKLPAILGKQLEKEKAQELKDKLTAIGCTINLI